MKSNYLEKKIKHILHVDSRGLYDSTTTLHAGREYRLRQTVQRIRDSFEDGDIDILRWVAGIANIADGLSKRNASAQRLVNVIASTGRLSIPAHEIYHLESKSSK